MCLAAACGVWDAGLGLPALDPTRGGHVRRARSRRAARSCCSRATASCASSRPGLLAEALSGREVFVHLDLDVLDPGILPSPFPAPGGLSDGGLRTLLTEVAGACDLIGCEITGFHDPTLTELIAAVVDPLVGRGQTPSSALNNRGHAKALQTPRRARRRGQTPSCALNMARWEGSMAGGVLQADPERLAPAPHSRSAG